MSAPLHEAVYRDVAGPVAQAITAALQARPSTVAFRGRLNIVVDNGRVKAQDVSVELRPAQPKAGQT